MFTQIHMKWKEITKICNHSTEASPTDPPAILRAPRLASQAPAVLAPCPLSSDSPPVKKTAAADAVGGLRKFLSHEVAKASCHTNKVTIDVGPAHLNNAASHYGSKKCWTTQRRQMYITEQRVVSGSPNKLGFYEGKHIQALNYRGTTPAVATWVIITSPGKSPAILVWWNHRNRLWEKHNQHVCACHKAQPLDPPLLVHKAFSTNHVLLIDTQQIWHYSESERINRLSLQPFSFPVIHAVGLSIGIPQVDRCRSLTIKKTNKETKWGQWQ